MSEHETPNWQPLSFLPDLAEMVDGMLESAEEVYHSLQQAQDRPHVLDDYTVGRVRDVHTTQRNDLWLYEEQLSRWQDAAPPAVRVTANGSLLLQHRPERSRASRVSTSRAKRARRMWSGSYSPTMPPTRVDWRIMHGSCISR